MMEIIVEAYVGIFLNLLFIGLCILPIALACYFMDKIGRN